MNKDLSPQQFMQKITWGNAKVGSQEIPGVTGKFGFGVQNEAGQRPTEFCPENALVKATPSSNNSWMSMYKK